MLPSEVVNFQGQTGNGINNILQRNFLLSLCRRSSVTSSCRVGRIALFAGLLEILLDLSTKLPRLMKLRLDLSTTLPLLAERNGLFPGSLKLLLDSQGKIDCTGSALSAAALIFTTGGDNGCLGHERFEKICLMRRLHVPLSLHNAHVLLLLRVKQMERQCTLAFLLYYAIYSCAFL